MKTYILLTSTLTRDFRGLTRTCILEVPYANAYAQLPRSLPRSCASFYEKKVFAYVNSYASLRTPYAHMHFGSSLRQCLRNAYAIPTPAVFFDGPYSGASARLAPSLRRHGATLRRHVLLTPILTRALRHTYTTAFFTIKI